jgi:hypothetical protein
MEPTYNPQTSNIGSNYDETKGAMSDAYDKTYQTVTQGYDQAMAYGRQNPGKMTLMAFGVGLGLGLMLAAGGRRSRMRRYGEPVVNAIADIAQEFIRTL